MLLYCRVAFTLVTVLPKAMFRFVGLLLMGDMANDKRIAQGGAKQ